MAKVIHIESGMEDDFIPLHKARKFIRGRKGKYITKKSLLNRVYRHAFPKGTYTKSSHGNYFFSKNYLLGVKTKPAA